MIHLAHFAGAKHYPRPWVAISNSVPVLRLDGHRKDLAPPWKDVKAAKAGTLSTEDFVRRYWHQLEALYAFGGESLELPDECTLLCWERPGTFCHRRILAAFLVRRGFEVALDGQRINETFRILEGVK